MTVEPSRKPHLLQGQIPLLRQLRTVERGRPTRILNSRLAQSEEIEVLRSVDNVGVSEEYELVDYARIQANKEREARNLQTRAKRAEKRFRLDEADDMKFSHSIQFNAVPDWSSHYIAYSNLKKLYATTSWIPSSKFTLTSLKNLPTRKEHPPTTVDTGC